MFFVVVATDSAEANKGKTMATRCIFYVAIYKTVSGGTPRKMGRFVSPVIFDSAEEGTGKGGHVWLLGVGLLGRCGEISERSLGS